MRVLAIDTALEACSAAVLDTERGGIARAANRCRWQRGHAEALMPLIARVHGPRPSSISPPSTASPSPPAPAASPGCGSASRPRAASRLPPASRRSACPRSPPSPRRSSPPTTRTHGGGRDRCTPRPRLSAGLRHRRPHARRAAHRAAARGRARRPSPAPPRIIGTAAANSWRQHGRRRARAALAGRAAQRTRHRLGRAARRRRGRRPCAPPKPLYLRAPDAQPQDAARLPRR